ncbi:MAG: AI-2E family transporter [Deltaproteobacteria bacterium HGW-Deltaproteobacteria-21]|nr:MAG: AI-2E family transporter [Deltaproteobacteria bacterium HGW-Deltaproteobacteria-21]
MAPLIIQEDPRMPPPQQTPSQPERHLVQILGGLLILAILYTLYFAKLLLLPIAIALLLSALLRPIVNQLRRLRLPEGISAAIVVCMLIGVVGFSAYRLSFPAADWFERGPRLIWKAEFKFSAVKKAIQEARESTRRLEEAARLEEEEKIREVVVKGPSITQRFLSQTQTVLVSAFITIVLLYFLLARGRVTFERWIGSFTDPGHGEKWKGIFLHIELEITRYLATITLINAGLGLATGISMALLGMPNPVLWGVVAGLLNFIPYVGGLITTVILAMVSLITFDTVGHILPPPLVFMFFTAMEGNFITPMIAGKRLGLNPLLLVVGLLFWGWIWGVPGMLLVVPIQASLKIMARNIPFMFSLREVIR